MKSRLARPDVLPIAVAFLGYWALLCESDAGERGEAPRKAAGRGHWPAPR
jgi:hypothetical protein